MLLVAKAIRMVDRQAPLFALDQAMRFWGSGANVRCTASIRKSSQCASASAPAMNAYDPDKSWSVSAD